jgi:hypothetical protein
MMRPHVQRTQGPTVDALSSDILERALHSRFRAPAFVFKIKFRGMVGCNLRGKRSPFQQLGKLH